MKSLLYVLGFALAALTGCATVAEGPGGRNVSMASLFPSDARAYAQTALAADSAKAMTASGTPGFISQCEPNGACTQVAIGGGSYGYAAGSGINPWAAQYVAMTSPPPGGAQGQAGGGTDTGLAATVDALGKRVEGVEGRVEGIDNTLGVVLEEHVPPKKK